MLTKSLYQTFADDYKLATAFPKIEYDPHAGSTEERNPNPERYKKQGIDLDLLDQMTDSLTVSALYI